MEDDTFKRILQDKQPIYRSKKNQREIIQNVLERKDSMAECYQRLRIAHVLRPPFLDKVLHHFFLSYGYL